VSTSVTDFVSVEANPMSPTLHDLCVWTEAGEKFVVRTDTLSACRRGRDAIAMALRTYEGWTS
jgi:hypothetical protein